MPVCVTTQYYRNQWTYIVRLNGLVLLLVNSLILQDRYRVLPSETLLKQFNSRELITN
jgi:hypothetical protein